MADPRHPDRDPDGDLNEAAPDLRPATGAPSWVMAAAIAIVIIVVLLVVVLHLTGVIGAGVHS